MHVLLVEDEPGIRDGLAAFLRLHGHVVRTAATCAEGVALAGEAWFDAVVTDWRLGDGTGEAVVLASDAPALIMSGCPEEIDCLQGAARVLGKPVTPHGLLVELDRLSAATAAPPADVTRAAVLATLPLDTRARVELVLALTGATLPTGIDDDGQIVTLRTPLPDDGDAALAILERIGGDLRVRTDASGPQLELRLHRDGRPGDARVLRADEPWPATTDTFSVDFHGSACTPSEFAAMAERAAVARAAGGTVHFLNVPAHLLLYADLLGQQHLLPKRVCAGPRLPAVLEELWRMG